MTKKEAGVGPSSAILTRLGLTEGIVERVRAEREARRKEQLCRARENGASQYIIISIISENSGYTPKEARQAHKKVLETIICALGMSEEELKEYIRRPLLPIEAEPNLPIFRAFAEGFGQEALRQGNLEIGITALDLSSENGILKNEPALDFIAEHTGTPEKRLAAAEIVQALVNQRAGNPPSPRVTV